MDQDISSVEKFRRQFYADLKQEDIDYCNARSKKKAVQLYRRKKSAEDPLLECFYISNNEIKKYSDVSSNRFASNENLRNNQIFDMISNRVGVTNDEIKMCKAAMRKEARSKNLPDLSSKPDDLQFLFMEYREKLPENFEKQRRVYGEIVCNTKKFEHTLENCLDVLKPLGEIRITADSTIDVVTEQITKMRCMMQEVQIFTNLLTENLSAVFEKFERYQDFDEEFDRNLFTFLCHFLPNFLIPRSKPKRKKSSK